MRKILAALIAALVIAVGFSSPASAAGPNPIPQATLSSYKFWPFAPNVDLCVAVGDTVIPIGVSAQSWNNATGGATGLNAANNCTTERQQDGTIGYPPSRRMTIDTYSAADGKCWNITNTVYATADTYRRWTNNPVGWVNRYYEGCYSTPELRAKWTSIVIGMLLGANQLHGSGWDSRVMSTTSGVNYPSASTDGSDMRMNYYGYFYGIY